MDTTGHMSCVMRHLSHVIYIYIYIFLFFPFTNGWSQSVEGFLSTGHSPYSLYYGILRKAPLKESFEINSCFKISFFYFGIFFTLKMFIFFFFLIFQIFQFLKASRINSIVRENTGFFCRDLYVMTVLYWMSYRWAVDLDKVNSALNYFLHSSSFFKKNQTW